MKNTPHHLFPESQAFASLLNAQPPEIQEAFQFPPATAMHEGGNPRFGKFDLLINVAFNAPLRSRRERADTVRHEHKDFLEQYGPQGSEVLHYLLDKYTDHDVAQLTDLHILELPDVPVQGTVIEIAELFGGVDKLKYATHQLQNLIYAA